MLAPSAGAATATYVQGFGGENTEGGHLSTPQGVALDSKGNVWVADSGHNRVQEFDSEGKFIQEFGAVGSTSGLFSEPQGIAIDSEGDVWVVDTGNSRLQEFSAKGEFLRVVGSGGTGNAKFSKPQGLVIDSNDNLWVADTNNNRVEELNSKGEFVRKVGSKGTEDGKFEKPQGVALDSKGNIWVADTGNNRIQKFDSEGKYLTKAGGKGPENGQLVEPQGLSVDSEGQVWVADTGNNRIQKFDSEGKYLSKFSGDGNEDGQVSEPGGLAIDSKGNVWVADTYNDRIQELDGEGKFVRKFGGENSGAGRLSIPGGIATDSKGNVWVADSGHNRIQEFDSEGKFVREFGALGTGDGLLSEPQGIAVDAEGNVWVADTGNNRIQEFTAKGELIRKFGSKGTGEGQLEKAEGIAIDSKGNVWVADTLNDRIQEFSSEGKVIRKFGAEGAGNGEFKNPKGIAIDSEGNVWAADTGNNRLQELTAEGAFIRKVGVSLPQGVVIDAAGDIWVASTPGNSVKRFNVKGELLQEIDTHGNDSGQLQKPQGVGVDSEGNVWIADTLNDRVQTFTKEGKFIRKFGGEGSEAGRLAEPSDVSVDPEGNAWVTDFAHNRVQEFNAKGEFIHQFGSEGSANDQFIGPEAITSDSKGNVWVATRVNHRIQEFNSKGEYLFKFGSLGSESGKFQALRDLAMDSSNHIWTVESTPGLPRAQEFTSEGKVVSEFGSEGAENGQLDEPEGIAIDAKGNVWVADTGNNRLQEFDSEGKFIRKVGTEGSGNLQFKSPSALAIGAGGELWVVDTGNNRVQRLAEDGIYVGQFGVAGNNNDQLSEPGGIGVDAKDTVWLADTVNDRVQEWSPNWPTVVTEPATAIEAAQATLNGKVNPGGSSTTYWFEYGETESYGTKIPASPKSVGSGTEYVAVSQMPTGLKKGTTYHFRLVAESEAGKVVGEDKFFTVSPPDGKTEPATAIKATQATLNGEVNPLGNGTTYWFEYGETTSYGTKIPVSPKSVGSGTEYVGVSQAPTGLKEGTTYHFRIVAEGEAGKATGEDKSFTTLKLPDATTEPATAIKATQATLNGKVNPGGSTTKYWFEYGETTSYGTKIPVSPESVGSGTEYVAVSQTPTGLKAGTTYHFRVVAEGEAGKATGEDKSFTTLKLPDATTEPATAIKATQATLNGKVNPGGSTTKYWFEYGETTSYGTKIPVSPESVGSGTEYVAVSQTPTGLKAGTTYHFRVVAEGEAGKATGEDKSFTTLKLPDATTEPATAIKATQATLNGKVNPLGNATTYWFEYGETTSYGTKIPVSPESVGSGTSAVAVSQTPTGLKAGTTYHFRVVAESETGKVTGADRAFTTSPPDATTDPATVIRVTQATLNGKVNPLGNATTYWFEYGETESYGTIIPVPEGSVGSGTSYVGVARTATGLVAATEYHFRLVAESEAGRSEGEDRTFISLESTEETTLCKVDEEQCEEENIVTHVHETTLTGKKAILKTSLLTVECDVLFLGDTVGERGAPLALEGSFTYSNCGGCTATEENSPAEIEIAREGVETGGVFGEGLVHVECSGLNCRYNGAGLGGTAKGPLLSTETNGEVAIVKQAANKESGLFCPATSELTITTTPLAAVYISE